MSAYLKDNIVEFSKTIDGVKANRLLYEEYKDRVETHFFLLNCNSKELVETDQHGELLANSQFKKITADSKTYISLCK